MFGYVVADRDQLTEVEAARYKSIYCGLCRTLKQKGGLWAQLTLTYDLTFAIVLLSSLYEPQEKSKRCRCYSHMLKGTDAVTSDITDYAADMNILLAYHNLSDDVADDGRLYKRAEMRLIKNCYKNACEKHPHKAKNIEANLRELSAAEARDADADTCANIFAEIMTEVFDYRQGMWSGYIKDFAAALGRVIYIMDAVDDIEKDVKKGSFNPLKQLYAQGNFEEKSEDILKSLLGECVEAFEKLPLENDLGIMRNILCSGIWTKLDAKKDKIKENKA